LLQLIHILISFFHRFVGAFNKNLNKMINIIKTRYLKRQETSMTSTSPEMQAYRDDYRFEIARRHSFQNWPVPFMQPAGLAAAGFYYTKHLDSVRCFECGVEICQWTSDKIPMKLHAIRSPDCRFIRNIYCGNVPIGVDPDTVIQSRQTSSNRYCPYNLQYRNDRYRLSTTEEPSSYELSCLGLRKAEKPVHADFANYESRVKTFLTWSTSQMQTKEELADAGFFYNGTNDRIICYHCGICLERWKIEGDPWVQHAVWSPTCCYLLIMQGWEFVNNVTGQNIYSPSAKVSTKTYTLNHN
jgi:baculoviral IAP repeat-containing protein 7/8